MRLLNAYGFDYEVVGTAKSSLFFKATEMIKIEDKLYTIAKSFESDILVGGVGNVYVAQVAMGANDNQTVKAIIEAEAYEGPSLIIAYSHCIAHGINMTTALGQQKAAVESGHWPLYRYNPERTEQGLNPLQLDSKAPKIPLEQYVYNETRFKMLTQSKPEAAAQLLELAQGDVVRRWRMYEQLAAMDYSLTTE